MPLDPSYRGFLEKVIDGTLSDIPSFVKAVRHPQRNLGIKDPDEYSYGFVQGYIIAAFMTAITAGKRKALGDEEFSEVFDVIARRGPEIREAIFKAG
jgi:hypothetical protein